MSEENKRNLQYFESTSMRELYESMEGWQDENKKRLLSVSIQKDEDKYCCIALTNPSEVVIVARGYSSGKKNDDDYSEIKGYQDRLSVIDV
jgi:hypothetical protein